jgi:hypothetical protein
MRSKHTKIVPSNMRVTFRYAGGNHKNPQVVHFATRLNLEPSTSKLRVVR